MGGLRRVDKACNICPTAKSTDFTKKKELWKVFRKNRKELFAYTVRGGAKMRKRRRSRFWPTRITAIKVPFM